LARLIGNARPDGSAAQTRHCCRRARIVDEDQSGRIEIRPGLKPILTSPQEVGPPRFRSQTSTALGSIETDRYLLRRAAISFSAMSFASKDEKR
jgi:hypothetical protein